MPSTSLAFTSRDQHRAWLAAQIEAAGGAVDQVAAYVRRPPRFSPGELARMTAAARDGSVWWFSSSEAVGNLQAALPGQDWAAARALATHARIAQKARELGFGQVVTCRPAVPDVLASLESMA